ncbi:MAG TPA: hypothetical protein VFR81_25065 [Longimicrobium sp.]|nr:hypothetical protein [Longimicrobium sp.]
MADPARSRTPLDPSVFPTPPLSVDASREILEEMARPPADTPERRAIFERARAWRPQLDRLFREMECTSEGGRR